MILNIFIWWLHRKYLKLGTDLLYIKGTGKHYPMYLLYTEKEETRNRMEKV